MGPSSGLLVGRVSPETAPGGAIARVEDDDEIEFDRRNRKVTLCVADAVPRYPARLSRPDVAGANSSLGHAVARRCMWPAINLECSFGYSKAAAESVSAAALIKFAASLWVGRDGQPLAGFAPRWRNFFLFQSGDESNDHRKQECRIGPDVDVEAGTRMIRTRFAPSPTGFLHIGGARTALFAWAFARRHDGRFILRVEDTDIARSTPEAVQAILDGMGWLGLDHDEGPFYQTQRMDRYKAVIDEMIAAGTAYRCYMSAEELEALRETQRARGQKPRYDGRWRDSSAAPPVGVAPVVRFKNPQQGVTAWNDLVKGRIEFDNGELDDLVIARADGTPTYNFCVCVDDWDMAISHVIRGDDHVNNTPRQINILRALGAPVPEYAHLSMILGDDGQKLSKRHGAVSVMQYDEEGYLPEAVLNYLARLGWSHGDDEIFDMAQFCRWFDLDHITPSAAQFNTDKLRWLNQQYLKTADSGRVAAAIRRRLDARGVTIDGGPDLDTLIALYKERAATLNELADALQVFYRDVAPSPALVAEHIGDTARAAVAALRSHLGDIEWSREALAAAIKSVVKAQGIKMPLLAVPLRVLLLGQSQSPSIDAVMAALGRERVLDRLERHT